jgi:hypothetical protein
MLLGDPNRWASQFVSLDERFIECIATVWPGCLAVLVGQPDEDNITRMLVAQLVKDPTVRKICHHVEYQFEPFGLNPDGSFSSKGKIDIAVLIDWERDRYLAYECKRLNVIGAGGRCSLATAYVTKGMMRFITEQYAERLPVGCMLGYVLDGDVEFAMTQLKHAIDSHAPLGLLDGPLTTQTAPDRLRFRTRHVRLGGTKIEIRHALLSHASCDNK